MERATRIKNLTLEEKASLCSGKDFWKTKEISRLGIASLTMSDGPYGIRKQTEEENYLDFHTAKKYICFPTAAGMAASFNRELWYLLGQTLAEECRAEGIDILLGPAMNIKRSPLGGRNFEYLSEDPLLSGTLAAEYVKGIQENGVSACVKHFAVNNQESRRMKQSSNVDERTLHEIYLSNFERVIREAKPDTVMCSYNQINHEYTAESRRLLTGLLREEWGFEGCVITDWGAVCDRVRGLFAGVDLEMPASGGETDREIINAVETGSCPEEVLDTTVNRILELEEKHRGKTKTVYSHEEHHRIAEKIAEECLVLLKNEDEALPLPESGMKIAWIGDMAENPRTKGGGSSHINSWNTVSPLDAAAEMGVRLRYAKGYAPEKTENTQALTEEALETAAWADCAVIFAGLPEQYESESYDRKDLKLPEEQNELIERIAAIQPRTVVVLMNGSPVEMPWKDRVSAILEAYLAGEGAGSAVAHTLFGRINPSGHLAETFPERLEDTPCYLDFPGDGDEVDYREGVFVGYRHYLSRRIPTVFPFGRGCSYTAFTYEIRGVSSRTFCEGEELLVETVVKNTGMRKGKAVLQLYVEPQAGAAFRQRPLRELRAFEKTELMPGEEKRILIRLDDRAFSSYDARQHRWYITPGEYSIQLGEDCETIVSQTAVFARPRAEKPMYIHRNTLLEDYLRSEETAEIIREELPRLLGYMGLNTSEEIPPFVYGLPLRAFRGFSDGKFTGEEERRLLERLEDAQKRKGGEVWKDRNCSERSI